MDSLQIEKILETNPVTRPWFKACLPSDLLSMPTNFPASYVVNMDSSRKEGSHWIGMFMPNKNEVFYFDSLKKDVPLSIDKFLRAFPRFKTNKFPYQSAFSETCGPHSIVFIYYMSLGYTFEHYTNLLNSIHDTDLFVKKIVNKLL